MGHREMGEKGKRNIWKILAATAAVAVVILLGFWASWKRGQRDDAGQTADSSSAGAEEPTQTKTAPTTAPTAAPTTEPELTATPEPTPALAEMLESIPSGTIVAEEEIDRSDLGQYFQAYEISDTIFARIYGDDRSYKTYCTVPREDLRYVKVLHYGYDGQIHVGELMVNALLAEDMRAIFQTLFENGYEIEKMCLVDDYGADDDLSINDNNTSCFNFRLAANAGNLSNHAAGCAIDINPKQNPYFVIQGDGSYTWENEDAELYIDRNVPDSAEKHMITHEDLCYQLFTQYGYTWGGDWGNPVDYQHFEKVVYLAQMPDAAVSE